jgi:hypothetical protein
MNSYLSWVAEQIGISVFLLVAFLLWSAVWKILALWKAARKKSLVWFIVLALVGTCGILEILYILVFSEMKFNKNKKPVKKRRKR